MADREVTVTLPSAADLIPASVRERIVQGVAALGVGVIQRRTEAGISVEGTPFAPYSAKYARLRAGSGRQTTPVSLHLSGHMLAGMKVLRSSEAEAVIGFEGSAPKTTFARERTATGKPAKGKKLRDGSRKTHGLRSAIGAQVANALKAKGHNDGTGKLPRRHFFGFSADERAALAAEAQRLFRLLAPR